jgi:hypothetical protein
VAKWLNSKSITAFILKYRTGHLLTNNVFKEFFARNLTTTENLRAAMPLITMGVADAKVAVAYVRDHASEWG